MNLEELARRKAHVKAIADAKRYHVTVPFLQDQESYLQETSRFLHWLNFELSVSWVKNRAQPADCNALHKGAPPPLHKP